MPNYQGSPPTRIKYTKAPRVPADLVEWLRKTYPERGIRVGQTEIEAHRYAAQVEMAQKLIKMGTTDDVFDVEVQT